MEEDDGERKPHLRLAVENDQQALDKQRAVEGGHGGGKCGRQLKQVLRGLKIGPVTVRPDVHEHVEMAMLPTWLISEKEIMTLRHALSAIGND
jgi:hypothetical protein